MATYTNVFCSSLLLVCFLFLLQLLLLIFLSTLGGFYRTNMNGQIYFVKMCHAKTHTYAEISPTKAAGMFSNVKHQVSGWLPSMPAMPTIPAMPAMPAMPSIPTIPGLKKHSNEADGAVDALANENPGAGGAVAPTGADDDEDRSRYIRYGPTINDSEIFFRGKDEDEEEETLNFLHTNHTNTTFSIHARTIVQYSSIYQFI